MNHSMYLRDTTAIYLCNTWLHRSGRRRRPSRYWSPSLKKPRLHATSLALCGKQAPPLVFAIWYFLFALVIFLPSRVQIIGFIFSNARFVCYKKRESCIGLQDRFAGSKHRHWYPLVIVLLCWLFYRFIFVIAMILHVVQLISQF